MDSILKRLSRCCKNNMEEKDTKKIKEIKKEKGKSEPRKANERFVALSPKTPIDIAEWRNIVKDNFPDLVFPAEIGLSVVAQLLIRDIKNPFALVYVDVPSSGKTITLNFFSQARELVYTTDNFTPASFVSHAANRPKADLEQNDMLPQIQYKTLIIRDLAPAFAKKDEDVQAMLGVFIRVLDGEGLETNSGLHGKRGYTGDYLFMLLSASTPIRSRIWKAMGNLGSRLFFLNIGGKEKSEEALAKQLKSPCHDKELICRMATEEFTKTLWHLYPTGVEWDKENEDLGTTSIVAKFAKVLAKLRSAINVSEEYSGSRKYNHSQPITEMPDRLNQLLYNLARGHALIDGRQKLSLVDMEVVARVAIDSAPPKRSKIFRQLILNGGSLTTGQVMELLDVSRPIALKAMRELVILKVVEVIGDIDDNSEHSILIKSDQKILLTEKYDWFGTEECKKLIDHTGQNSLLT